MELFKIKKDIPFMSYAKSTTVASAIMFILAVFFLITKGLNLGVDFTGGTVMEVSYANAVDVNKVRGVLNAINLTEVTVQNFGNSQTILIRLPAKQAVSGAKLSESVMQALTGDNNTARLRRVDFVGPQVGKELVENGTMALLLVSIGIVLYLTMRFKWHFAIAGIIANLHDIVIILGFFSFFQWEFSLPVLAAILAILGYSVNESVVVFDRIRENTRKMRKAPVPVLINNAITQTMSRTIITHACTQLMVTSMLIFGGEPLHYFALALTIGILFGIYSSVLVASPIVMWWWPKNEAEMQTENKAVKA